MNWDKYIWKASAVFQVECINLSNAGVEGFMLLSANNTLSKAICLDLLFQENF